MPPPLGFTLSEVFAEYLGVASPITNVPGSRVIVAPKELPMATIDRTPAIIAGENCWFV